MHCDFLWTNLLEETAIIFQTEECGLVPCEKTKRRIYGEVADELIHKVTQYFHWWNEFCPTDRYEIIDRETKRSRTTRWERVLWPRHVLPRVLAGAKRSRGRVVAQWAGETFVAYILLELGRTKRVSSALTFRFAQLHPSALCHVRPTRNDLRVCRVVCINHSEERACARKDDVRLADAEVVRHSNWDKYRIVLTFSEFQNQSRIFFF